MGTHCVNFHTTIEADSDEDLQRKRDELDARVREAMSDVNRIDELERELAKVTQERDDAREALAGLHRHFEALSVDLNQQTAHAAIFKQKMDEARDDAAEMRGNYERACKTIADMHKAAMGEVCGPKRGVVEDVADLRAMHDRYRANAERLAGFANSVRQMLDENGA